MDSRKELYHCSKNLGAIKSDSIQYTIGNVMYLCPVHKSLYSRSKNSKLMWIPVIDEAKQQIEANPTKETVEEWVNAIGKIRRHYTRGYDL